MKRLNSGRIMLCILIVCALLPWACPVAGHAESSEYLYGKAEYISEISGEPVGDSCYFSDSWFQAEAGERNDSLALVSAQLSAAAGESRQSTGLLKALGFADVRSMRYDSAEKDDCAYTIGMKTIARNGAETTLAAVVFQGSRYGAKGWEQNVTVNPDTGISGDHAAYAAAADAFLADLDDAAISGETVFWITGQSRGGAVANVVSAMLLDRGASVYCYTFEAPAVTQNEAAGSERYRSIHNYICDDDVVTMLPIWGMKRYGSDVVYNTAPIDEVKAALVRQNPGALAVTEEYSTEDFSDDLSGFLRELIRSLEISVPSREDYTRIRTAVLPDGGQVQYTYQEGLQALCHIVFDSPGELSSAMSDILGNVKDLVFAYMEEYAASVENGDSAALAADAVRRRWDMAGVMLEKTVPLTAAPVRQADLYALLEFLSPLFVNTSCAEEGGWTLTDYENFDVSEYFENGKLVAIGTNGGTMVFSHQPDVIISRLKLAAPAPGMQNIALEIKEPAAGDASGSAPSEATAGITALEEPWLTVRGAEWLADDNGTLADDRVWYLRITLDAVGHTVPEDFQFALNGREPVSREIRYENGSELVTGVWLFRLGSPAQVSVNFDTGGHGDPPEAIPAEAGTILRYAGLKLSDPGMIRDDSGLWSFTGWKCEDGSSWEEAAAAGDVTLQAGWFRMVDSIDLAYEIPHIGDSGEKLETVTAPEGAPYRVMSARLANKDYESVSVAKDEGEYHISFSIFLADDNARFLGEEDEEGLITYLGTASMNGEKTEDVWIDINPEEEGAARYELTVRYYFTPLP